MISEEITADLKKGLSIDEVLTKHNTNLKELFKHPENPKPVVKSRKPKNYWHDKRRDVYIISKTFNKKRKDFGQYKSEKEVKLAVELFEKYGWNKEDVWRVKAEVNEILLEELK